MKIRLKSKIGRPCFALAAGLSPDDWREFDVVESSDIDDPNKRRGTATIAEVFAILDLCELKVDEGGMFELDAPDKFRDEVRAWVAHRKARREAEAKANELNALQLLEMFAAGMRPGPAPTREPAKKTGRTGRK